MEQITFEQLERIAEIESRNFRTSDVPDYKIFRVIEEPIWNMEKLKPVGGKFEEVDGTFMELVAAINRQPSKLSHLDCHELGALMTAGDLVQSMGNYCYDLAHARFAASQKS